MIEASKAGFLFRSTEQIKKDHPELAAYETYDELFDAIKKGNGSVITERRERLQPVHDTGCSFNIMYPKGAAGGCEGHTNVPWHIPFLS